MASEQVPAGTLCNGSVVTTSLHPLLVPSEFIHSLGPGALRGVYVYSYNTGPSKNSLSVNLNFIFVNAIPSDYSSP